MLRIDRRKGSGELAGRFLQYGIQPEVTTLDFGDFDFTGRGPDGLCSIVIERKVIDDLIQSMESNRFSGHQLKGMARKDAIAEYDYGYLLVEGIWKPGPAGELLIFRGRDNWEKSKLPWSAVFNFSNNSMPLRAGMIPIRTGTVEETVAAIVATYKSWQTPWEEHRSHDAVYAPANIATRWEGGRFQFVPRRVSLCEQAACQLEGLQEKAQAVAEHFGSMADMARAGESQWSQVVWKTKQGKPRKFGKKTVKAIVAALRTKGYVTGDTPIEVDGAGEEEIGE